jgi:hypothetical protein
MTNRPDDTPADRQPPGVLPGAGDGHRPVWYRRTWVIVTAAIVAVIGASILVDLPRTVSTAEDVASQTATLKEINTDVAPCGYAVNETFLIHHDQVAGTLTPADRQSATKMLTDDQTTCSFTNGSIFDLTNNIQVQDTAAGKYVDRMLSVTTTWATSDALAAVEDIQYLYLHPGDRAKARDLIVQEKLLAQDRAQAVDDIQRADALLHAHLPDPNLPSLPMSSA